MTSGSYAAQTLTVTESGRVALGVDTSIREAKQKQFELAVGQFDSFNNLYERLRDGRVPGDSVLKDDLGRVGVQTADLQRAAEIFTANIRYLGLVTEINDNQYVRTIEQVVGELSSADEPVAEDIPNDSTEAQPSEEAIVRTPTPAGVPAKEPSVHIDVQVHIDSSASPDQIDQIFSSMARHLYGREG